MSTRHAAVQRMADLQDGWNGPNTFAMTPECLAAADTLATVLPEGWQVMPYASRSLCFTYVRKEHEATIDITHEGTISSYVGLEPLTPRQAAEIMQEALVLFEQLG